MFESDLITSWSHWFVSIREADSESTHRDLAGKVQAEITEKQMEVSILEELWLGGFC